MKILHYEETDSTVLRAKALIGGGEDLVVTAVRQTGGMGTKGRSFASEAGGVYLTRLTFYKNFPASDAFKIMAGASVAVCRTLENYGLTAEIRTRSVHQVAERRICGG